jgi:RND superfamily putative drug exporter
MRRPLVALLPALGLVLLAGSPFLHIRLAQAGITTLPPAAESRQTWDAVKRQFPAQEQTRIWVVAQFPGTPLTADRVGALYDLDRQVQALDGVLRADSIVDLDPALTRADYQRMYGAPLGSLPPAVRMAVRSTVGRDLAVLSVLTAADPTSDQARRLVRAIRALELAGGQVLVTGPTAIDLDSIDFMAARTPAAITFVVLSTLVVLFLLLGTVVLPIKAVLMNALSIAASFGALVWVFQDGHLTGLLGITPAPIDPTVPVLLFCIVFGLSMDYEVLMLTRMKEERAAGATNIQAVAAGLQRCGRLITGAAAIMILVFSAFALADVVVVKAIGLGLAIAVAVDATLVRSLIVPASMRLLGDLNWWVPGPLERLHRRLSLAEPAS